MAGHSLPPLKALRVFEAAARLRSFTAAADELSITHSAVSQQIRILEDHVGSPVRARGARRALLPCAQAYFPEVQASLERIAAATAKLRAPGFTGTLRVCATPSLTMKWLIPRLSCFQALHPGIDVQLTTQGRSFLDRGGDAGRRAAAPWLHGACRAELRALPGRFPCAGGLAALHRTQPAGRAGRLPGPSAVESRGGMDYWPRWFALAKVDVPAQLPGRCSTITSSACRPP